MFAVLIDQFWSLTIAGVALGFIYVLISLGYTMVYGVLRMINFANSEIFMWGTFGTVITSRDIFHYTHRAIFSITHRLQNQQRVQSWSWF
jgi:branched-chain amino acid transport system permease protein